MTNTLRRNARLLLGSDPETSPLLRVIGTVLLGLNLVYNHSGPVPLWLWIVFGAAYAWWLVYALCGDHLPLLAAGALGGCALLAAVASGKWPDPATVTAPVILMWVAMSQFGQQISVRTRTVLQIAAVVAAALVVSLALAGQTASHILTALGAGVIALLAGLYRRQYRLRTHQTELLLEQTRLTQQEHARAAALDERARIAREMHDVLAHSLGALTVQLEVAEGLLSEKGDVTAALTHVRRSHRLALDGLTEARGAVAALREDVPPLPEAVRGLVENYRRDHRMTVEFLLDGEPRTLPSAAIVSLLRATREALTNAGKHAPGAPVTVALTFAADRVRLSVRNPIADGAGATRAPDAVGGYGLTGMRERIALVGGTLFAGLGRDGRDWQVTAEVPND
jgi:signal transduction histidine kinase